MLGKDIKNLVVVKMEEHTPYGPSSGATLLAGGDVLEQIKPIDSYINQSLTEAANEILGIVPIHRLMYKDAGVSGTPDAEDAHIGTIALPDDFLRLHTLRMSGWSKPIHEAITAGHPAYSLQHSRWTRGTQQKPVAVLDGRGIETMEYADKTPVVELHFLLPSDSKYSGDLENIFNTYGDYYWELISDDSAKICISMTGHDTPAPDAEGIEYDDKGVARTLTKGQRVRINLPYEFSPEILDYITAYAEMPEKAGEEREVVVRLYQSDEKQKAWHIRQELHYYSVDAASSHPVKELKYIPVFSEDMDYELSIAELIALQCARKIYEIYGNTEQVTMMTNEINSVLENIRQ